VSVPAQMFPTWWWASAAVACVNYRSLLHVLPRVDRGIVPRA
jgi:hypothetical protein